MTPRLRAKTEAGFASLKRKPDAVIITCLFLVTTALHLATAARTVTFSDSGDFLMGIALVGNSHGPGYPLYLTGAKLFSWIFPFGSLPFRVSVFSGVFAAITTCLLYWIVKRMAHSRAGGLVAGLVFAFSYTYWYETVVPESYSINTFFMALLVVLILRWDRLTGQGRGSSADNTLALIAFCYGLAMGDHFSIILLVPAFAFFALDTDWRSVLAPRNLARMAVFFVLGLLPYLYLPTAAFRGPAYNYGDPSTVTAWFRHATFYYTRGGLFQLPLQLLPGRFWRFFVTLTTEFPYFFWLGAVGLVVSFFKREKKHALFLVLLFLLSTLPVMTYNQLEPILRAHFYYPAYMVVAIWIGVAAAFMVRVVADWSSRRDPVVAVGAVSVLVIALLVCPLVSVFVHYDKVDKSGYYFAEDQARNMLDTAAANGVVLVDSDNVIFPLLYLQNVERYRPEARVVCATAAGVPGFQGQDLLAVTPPGYSPGPENEGAYVQMVNRNGSLLPVYTTDPTVVKHDWKWQWLGYLDRLYPAGAAVADAGPGPAGLRGANSPAYKDTDAREAILLPRALQAAALLAGKKWGRASEVYGETIASFMKDIYVPTLYSCATFAKLFEMWGQSLNAEGRFEDTITGLPRAREIDPTFASTSLARAYVMTGRISEGVAEFERYLVLNPGDVSARVDLAQAYMVSGDFGRAEAMVKRAIDASGDDARAHYLYGLVLLKTDRRNMAIDELSRALEIDPGGPIGKKALEQLSGLPRE